MRAILRLSYALLLVLLAASGLRATTTTTSTTLQTYSNPCSTTRPNIILILADDLWFGDLPWFSPPIDWDQNPLDPMSQEIPSYRIQQPTLNRFAARLLAKSDGTYGTFPAAPEAPPPLALAPGATTTSTIPGAVKPIDDPTAFYNPDPDDPMAGTSPVFAACRVTTNTCQGFSCTGDPCDRRKDVLAGVGGFRRIADQGAVFGRYYTTSAFCGPARSSVITGRHTNRTGVGSNGVPATLDEEVFIPEWLRQGCTQRGPNNPPDKCYLSGGCASAPCYYTGYFGKWHLGGTPPENQGFREFGVSFSSARAYFESMPLHCNKGDPLTACTQENDPEQPNLPRNCCDSSGYLAIYGNRDVNGMTGVGKWWCNDDSRDETNGSADPMNPKGGCPYSQRVYEVLAEDFIDRALTQPHPDGAHAFFLMLSLNAVHIPRSAPKRTTAHYNTTDPMLHLDPRSRDRGDVYWAVVEEIDASIGKLYQKLGDPNGDGNHDDSIVGNTVVLFTNDHGGPTRAYGIPELRGGKGGIWEGGSRIGLLASACGNHGHPVGDRSTHIANHTDLFPTIAEAAGIPVPATWNELGSLARPIDGISFYSVLAGGSEHVRDYTFARYHGQTVTARPGLYPDGVTRGVCGFSGANAMSHVAVRGGSCLPCVNFSDCESKACRVLGKVCVTASGPKRGTCVPAKVSECVGDSTKCDCKANSDCPNDADTCTYPAAAAETFRRCINNADCQSDQAETCMEVSIQCNQCAPPTWKLRTPPNPDAAANNLRLYDLTTNPEEIEALECNHNPKKTDGSGSSDPQFGTVLNELACRVAEWSHCTAHPTPPTTGATCTANCDKWWGRSVNHCPADAMDPDYNANCL